jgi:hypothetical protein
MNAIFVMTNPQPHLASEHEPARTLALNQDLCGNTVGNVPLAWRGFRAGVHVHQFSASPVFA